MEVIIKIIINHKIININYNTNHSYSVPDSNRRFPFLAWQNGDIREETQYQLETVFQPPVYSNTEQSLRNTANLNGAAVVKNPPDNKKLEEQQLTDVLQNAISSNDKDYIQLYKDIKNGNYNSATQTDSPRPRHTQDQKSDNSANYDVQVPSALENAISRYPYTDYTKLYKDLKASLANSPTTSQPFTEEESDRFPESRHPTSGDDNQQYPGGNNWQSKVVTPQPQPGV